MDLTVETLPDYNRRHHCPGGFQNVGSHQRPLSLWKGVTWSARRIFHDKEHRPPPVQSPDTLELRRRPNRLRITWIGHTTVLVQTPGFTLLTDPIFADRASPVAFAGPSRLIPPALPVRDLPPIDAVLLSHDHYDHCDQTAIEELARRFEPTFFVPLGVASHLRRWGVGPTVELDWWQRATFHPGDERGALRLTCAPAQHFSGRSLFDRNATLWASWMIEAPAEASPAANGRPDATNAGDSVRVYFGGDTGDGDYFADVRERIGAPEVALLPIGAFEPRELMAPVHIAPEEALDAFEALGAGYFIPTHWGTFDLSEETVQAPAALLEEEAARRGLSGRVLVPDPGEIVSLSSPPEEEASPLVGEEAAR